jgi:hypothetical protein
MRFAARLLLPALTALSLMAGPLPAAAQNLEIIPSSWTSAPCNIQTGELEARCIPMFIGHLIQLVVSVISIFFLINVMFAGYEIAYGYATGETSAGKDRLKWSIIGLIICVCCFLILDLIVTVIAP